MGIRFDKISISGSINSVVTPIAPSYWIATAGIASINSVTGNIAVDSTGSIYTVSALNAYTVVLNKFNSSGSLAWSRSVSGNPSYTSFPTNLQIDSSDNVVFVTRQRDASFTTGIVYVMKISGEGSLIWQKSIQPPSGYMSATRIKLHPTTGAIHIVGETYGSSFGANDIYYGIVSADGVSVSNRVVGSAGSELGHAIDIDSSGNIYFGGYAGGDPYGTTKLMVSKYNSSLVMQYSSSHTTPYNERIFNISLSGNALRFVGDQTVSTRDALVGAIATVGNNVPWARRLSGTGSDYFYSSVVDTDGTTYALGTTTSTTSGLLNGLILAAYSSTGSLLWQRIIEKSTTGIVDAGLALQGDNICVSGTSTSGSHLFKLPKDGTLTGVYGSFTYRTSTLTDSSVTMFSTSESQSIRSVTYNVTTPSLSASVISPTSTVISL